MQIEQIDIAMKKLLPDQIYKKRGKWRERNNEIMNHDKLKKKEIFSVLETIEVIIMLIRNTEPINFIINSKFPKFISFVKT